MPRSKKTKHYFGTYYDLANEILSDPALRAYHYFGQFSISGMDNSRFHEKYGLNRHRTVYLKLTQGEIQITNIGKAPTLYIKARNNGWTYLTCDDMDSFSGFRKNHFDGMPFYAEIREKGQVVQSTREGRDVIYKDRNTDEVLYKTYCQKRWYPYPKVFLSESGRPLPLQQHLHQPQRYQHFGWSPEKYNCVEPASAIMGALYEHGWRGAKLSRFGDWIDSLSEELEGKLITVKPPKSGFAALVLTGNPDHFVLTASENLRGSAAHSIYQWEPERYCEFNLGPDLVNIDRLNREIAEMTEAIVKRKEARLLDTLPLC